MGGRRQFLYIFQILNIDGGQQIIIFGKFFTKTITFQTKVLGASLILLAIFDTDAQGQI